ncbi:MAG: hypothetical protein L6Q66_05955 [Bacteroidia bacterium]|nr:hypothetical protein [Bacteroidia bacterium]
MDKQEYDNWLSRGCNYDEGVKLYFHYGSSKTLKDIFAKGDTYFNRKKLKSALLELVSAPAETIAPTQDFKVHREPKKKVSADNLPDSLKSEYYQLGPIWSKIRFLHSRLDLISKESERNDYAQEIVELSAQRRSIFNKIDAYNADPVKWHKQNDVKIDIKEAICILPPVNYWQLKEELLRLRVQRSKLKKKPHRAEDYAAVLKRITEIEEGMRNV